MVGAGQYSPLCQYASYLAANCPVGSRGSTPGPQLARQPAYYTPGATMSVPTNTTDLITTNPQPVGRCRLSVVEYVHHQQPGQQPRSVEHRFCRDLHSGEQTYIRTFQATEEWKPLDTGWLGAEVGHLILINEEGRNPSSQLSPEEKIQLSQRWIELGLYMGEGADLWFVEPFAKVRPGESIRLTPYDVSRIRVRCPVSKSRCTITLIPA